MAFPQIVGTALSFRNSNSTSDSVTLPGSIASGDLIIVFHMKDGVGTNTRTFPSPWVEIRDAVVSGGTASIGVAYLIASGGETSVTVTTTKNERFTAIAIRISAASWHGTTPPEISSGAVGASANPNPDSVTASWGSADNLFIAFFGQDNGSTVSSWPTNYDSNQLSTWANNNGGSSAHGAIATDEVASATQNPGTFTMTSEQWWAGTVVVRPAAGASDLNVNESDGASVGETTTLDPVSPTNVSESDGLSIADSPTMELADTNISEVDSLTVGETVSLDPVTDPPVSVSDGLVLADVGTLDPTFPHDVAEEDGVSLGELTGAEVAINLTIADGQTIGESVTLAPVFPHETSVLDALTIGQ
jgi:hypothetical protein